MTTAKAEDPLELLRKPFDPSVVKWRPGNVDGTRALALAYVDARDVMERLDAAFGPFGWGASFRELSGNGSPVECTIRVYSSALDKWIEKSDIGYSNDPAGKQKEPEPEPLKAAYSDAFKRAAVHWGVGRDLYEMPQFWLPLNQYKRFEAVPQFVNGKWVEPGAGKPQSAVSAVQQAATATAVAADKDRPAPEPLRTKLLAKCKDNGLTEPQIKAMYMTQIAPTITSSKQLSVAQVEKLLVYLDDPKNVESAKEIEVVAA